MASLSLPLGQVQKLRIAGFWIIGVSLGTMLLFVRSAWTGIAPLGIEIEEFVELFGFALIGIAVTGRLWATLYVGGRKSSVLVQDGPYSVTRNPLYVFSTIGALGVGFQSGSVVVGLLAACITAIVLLATGRREADFLRSSFGAEFEAYEKRVPMFFPRFSLYSEPEVLQILPARLYRTLGDGLFFFMAMPLFEFIDILQEQHFLPVLVRLY